MHRKVALAVRAAFIVTAAFVYATPSTAKIGFTASPGLILFASAPPRMIPFQPGSVLATSTG